MGRHLCFGQTKTLVIWENHDYGSFLRPVHTSRLSEVLTRLRLNHLPFCSNTFLTFANSLGYYSALDSLSLEETQECKCINEDFSRIVGSVLYQLSRHKRLGKFMINGPHMRLLEDFQVSVWLRRIQEEGTNNISSILVDRVTRRRTLLRIMCALSKSVVNNFVFVSEDNLNGILGRELLNYLRSLNVPTMGCHRLDMYFGI